MSKLDCTMCVHYEVCNIITTFKNAVKKHSKVFIPREDSEGPTKKLLSIFAGECKHFSTPRGDLE